MKRMRTRAAPGAAHGQYVVQKDPSRNLHFDLRLEHDGALLGWSVPKGPSLDRRDRRLAVRIEDHPIEPGAREGVAPPSGDGAGAEDLWDRGRWIPEGDVARGLERGRLDFRLVDGRLAGDWHLVRLAKSRSRPRTEPAESWLLVHGKSPAARAVPRPGKSAKKGQRYGKKAAEKVERAMHEMKRGKLRSGGSGKKVRSRKQAIAIGLSQAREAGGKVPPPPRSRKKTMRKKATRKK